MIGPAAIYHLCKSCKTMTQVKQILALIIHSGTDHHLFSLSNLLLFSATSDHGDLEFATLVFKHLHNPNTLSYNAMIRAYSSGDTSGSPERSLVLFMKMKREGIRADNYTYPFVLKACSLLLALELGKSVHGLLLNSGYHSDLHIRSGLVRFYAECGVIDSARQLFDEIPQRDVILWNSIIGAYAKSGVLSVARMLFDEMRERNVSSYNIMICAYAKNGDIGNARKLFDQMPQRDVVSWNTMVVGYARFGLRVEAHSLFEEMPMRNLSSWSGFITGLAQSSRFEEALDVFVAMQVAGVKPNQAILVGALSSCAHLGALEQGMWIHAYIERGGLRVDDKLCAALVDMYSKCGFLEGAKFVFLKTIEKDVCAWTAIISGFSYHSQCEEAIRLFEKMQRIGVKPNKITYVSVLSACVHGDMVNKGREIFNSMYRTHQINPSLEHYTCMVDLLSRTGYMEQAIDFVRTMPMTPDSFIWGALLNGFLVHGVHRLLTENVVAELTRLKLKGSGTYVLMSNIYASIDHWDDVIRLREVMAKRGIQKNPGCSLIEVDGVVHEFFVGEKSHPQSSELYLVLNLLNKMTKVTTLYTLSSFAFSLFVIVFKLWENFSQMPKPNQTLPAVH